MAKKVLIVENHRVLRKLFEDIFNSRGCETYTAENEDEGLRVAKENLPNLVLTDITPGDDGLKGYKLCDRLKKDEATKSIPVICISNYEDYKTESINMGAVEYLVKPVGVEDIERIIKTYLEK